MKAASIPNAETGNVPSKIWGTEEKLRLMWAVSGPYYYDPFTFLNRLGISVPIWTWSDETEKMAGREPTTGDEEFGRKLGDRPFSLTNVESSLEGSAKSSESECPDNIAPARSSHTVGLVEFSFRVGNDRERDRLLGDSLQQSFCRRFEHSNHVQALFLPARICVDEKGHAQIAQGAGTVTEESQE